jgi:hypothetical protein
MSANILIIATEKIRNEFYGKNRFGKLINGQELIDQCLRSGYTEIKRIEGDCCKFVMQKPTSWPRQIMDGKSENLLIYAEAARLYHQYKDAQPDDLAFSENDWKEWLDFMNYTSAACGST